MQALHDLKDFADFFTFLDQQDIEYSVISGCAVGGSTTMGTDHVEQANNEQATNEQANQPRLLSYSKGDPCC